MDRAHTNEPGYHLGAREWTKRIRTNPPIVRCGRCISVRHCVVGLVQVPLVHCHTPYRSSGSFGCVRSIPVRPEGIRVRSGAFSPFSCALGVGGFVRVRSVHSRQLWESSGSIGSDGTFPCSLGVVVLVGVRSVHSRAHWFDRVSSVHSHTPWRSSGSIGSVRSIPVLPAGRRVLRVRSVRSNAPLRSSGSFGCVRSIPVRPEGC